MSALQIYDPRERRLVAAADRALSLVHAVRSVWRRTAPDASPRRILLLRLERIGDLLMAAAGDRRRTRAGAGRRRSISWSAAGTSRSRGPFRLSHESRRSMRTGSRGGTSGQSVHRAAASGPVLAATAGTISRSTSSRTSAATCSCGVRGASFTAGYWSGGGGGLLDRALDYDPRAHTTRQRARASSRRRSDIERPDDRRSG